jgi:hypothetical protein
MPALARTGGWGKKRLLHSVLGRSRVKTTQQVTRPCEDPEAPSGASHFVASKNCAHFLMERSSKKRLIRKRRMEKSVKSSKCWGAGDQRLQVQRKLTVVISKWKEGWQYKMIYIEVRCNQYSKEISACAAIVAWFFSGEDKEVSSKSNFWKAKCFVVFCFLSYCSQNKIWHYNSPNEDWQQFSIFGLLPYPTDNLASILIVSLTRKNEKWWKSYTSTNEKVYWSVAEHQYWILVEEKTSQMRDRACSLLLQSIRNEVLKDRYEAMCIECLTSFMR